jgi:NADH-quinone oxidoreductase subunit E
MSGETITALSATELAQINAELAHVPYPSAAAIEALKIVQQHRGWVSDASLQAIAKQLQMSATELDSIATFYNQIFRLPVGKKIIFLCNSVSCWIKGSDDLQQQISEQLGITPGETTADDEYTFIPVPCLGACDKAPVMMVGEDLHHNVNGASIKAIFHNATEGSGE